MAMATETVEAPVEEKQLENGSKNQPDGPPKPKITSSRKQPLRQEWPTNILEAYRRSRGIYTAANVGVLLAEEPLELFNGWLVWKKMTDAEDRRIASIIEVIVTLAARHLGFGQTYPDQLECVMINGDTFKPDVSLISDANFDKLVQPVAPGREHKIFKGGPDLVVEIRSPSNTRQEERRKRQIYFESGTQVVWDVDPKKQRMIVYEVENPDKGIEYPSKAEISCERLLPGWRRPVRDFFSKTLTAEDMAGDAAKQWRAESRAEGEALGRAEGELDAIRKIISRQLRLRFGLEFVPAELEARLRGYNGEQLTDLVDKLMVSSSLEEWQSHFPE